MTTTRTPSVRSTVTTEVWRPQTPPDAPAEHVDLSQEPEFRPWRPSPRLRLLLLANLGLAAFYLTWWLSPGHVGVPVLFGLLAAAEAFNLVHLVGLWWAIWATKVDPPPRSRTQFSIDVFIPTCGEPLDVIERTVTAALDMELAHTTYVLDDGDDPEVEALARNLGARYVTRTGRKGAKAGNLNHALAKTDGQLFAIFDADHVPRRDFLRRILGYFEDASVGFVQTPQYYGNSVDNEVARGAYQQQAIFYGPICRGKNGLSSAFCCGTNVVFRRDAIEEVGGFDEKSVVEDFVTSMRVHRRGWRSVYYPYVLAEGLGPSNLRSYFRQQFRWARGSIGALVSLEPFKPGFTLGQRVQYLLATTFYVIGLVTTVYIALPILFLVFGLSAFSVNSGTFLLFYAPYIIFALVTIRWGLGGQLRLEHVRYTYGSFPVYALAAIAALLKLPARFAVTSKHAEDRPRPPALAWVTGFAFAATIVAMSFGLLTRTLGARTITNLSWGFINVLLLGGIAGVAFREVMARRRPETVRVWETLRLVRALRPIAGGAPGLLLESGSGNGKGAITIAESHRLILPEHAVPPEMPPAPRGGAPRAGLIVAGLTLLGFLLRMLLIDAQSLRLDESLSLNQVQVHPSLPDLWNYLMRSNVHVPLYHTILHFWIKIAGTSEWAIRVPSVLFGTASIPLLYVVGRRLVGPRAAILAATLGAASPFWVWHSDEARMYALLLFLALASMALLFQAIEQGGPWRWVAYAAVTGISLYAHYFAILMLPVHFVYLLVHHVPRRKIFAWLAAAAGAGLMFLPWLIPLYLDRIETHGVSSLINGVRAEQNFGVLGLLYGSMFFVVTYLLGYAIGLGYGVGILATLSRTATGSWPLMAILGVTRRRSSRLRNYRPVVFLTAWLILTMGVVFILNIIKPGLWLQRYLIIASPAVFLAVAAMIARVVRIRPVGIAFLFVILASAAVMDNLSTSNPVREDYRTAADLVRQGFHQGDVVVVLPPYIQTPFRYYFNHEGPGTVRAFFKRTNNITQRALPKIAETHPGSSLWTVTDTVQFVPPEIPRYLNQSFTKTDTCGLGRLRISRYLLPGPDGQPASGTAILSSTCAPGGQLLLAGSGLRVSTGLAWFLGVVNLLCVLGALGAFLYARKNSKGRRLPWSARRRDGQLTALEWQQQQLEGATTGSQESDESSGDVPIQPRPIPEGIDVWVKRSSPRTDDRLAENDARIAKLIEQLDDEDPFLRISAINGLRGRPDVDHLLIRSLFDEYPLVRREAVRALKDVGSSKATEALIEVAGHDPSAEVREEAVAALGAMVRERRGGSGSAPV